MSRLRSVLGLELPLLQAGMGGIAGPELCAAVSGAGAGGTLALYKEPPERVRELVRAVVASTSRPFGVNVIPEVAGPVLCRAQLSVALEELPGHAFVTSFGLPDAWVAHDVVRSGRALVIQVGTLHDAAAALRLGAGVLVLQGTEAGGHHLGELPAERLLYDVRARYPDAVLVVAGGVATGRDLVRVLARGADGAMAGTLFVPTVESAAHPHYKERVAEATADDTVVTTRFDIGWPRRPHRVLRNPVTGNDPRRPATFIATTLAGGRRLPVPRYSAAVPVAATVGRIEEMAMYCGRSCSRVTGQRPAAVVVEQFRRTYEAADPSRETTTEGGPWTSRSNR
ncbi:nitronate monooxygenase [Streptomyces sp. NBC_01077]|uniref:NAD(P)H-dependent flavin oxidoreductase n=1 Tax=Streptomyces sp. NBC_01077 TaxID=2903746 RepID=UPI00386C13E2|nr:nitronate monooxygenase [Streptomyces sp. NBC_01077]